MSSVKWRPFCFALNVLNLLIYIIIQPELQEAYSMHVQHIAMEPSVLNCDVLERLQSCSLHILIACGPFY